jgi:hypothetical protein
MFEWIRLIMIRRRSNRNERCLHESRLRRAREAAVLEFRNLHPNLQPWRGYVEVERENDYIVSVGWNTDSKPFSAEYFVVRKDTFIARILQSEDQWSPPTRR